MNDLEDYTMQNYPRIDGSWSVYIIQALYEKDETNTWGTYTWVDRYDNRERCEALGLVYEETTLQASGNIWQQSGIHGTESLEYAKVILRLCRQNHPEHSHRIVLMNVSRSTVPVDA
jgi:hypothetical protein